MSLITIFEDDYLICVHKPNNMLVHHAHHSRNISDETSLLQLIFKEKGLKVYPIHRLDRKTSGIILLAKETKYVSKFQDVFITHEIQKPARALALALALALSLALSLALRIL